MTGEQTELALSLIRLQSMCLFVRSFSEFTVHFCSIPGYFLSVVTDEHFSHFSIHFFLLAFFAFIPTIVALLLFGTGISSLCIVCIYMLLIRILIIFFFTEMQIHTPKLLYTPQNRLHNKVHLNVEGENASA